MRDKIIELLKDKEYHQRSIEELAWYFEKTSTNDYIDFIKLMNKLEEEGIVARDDENKYFLGNDLNFFKGIIQINKRGFAFVRIDEDKEFYINERNIKDAFDSDEVLVKKLETSKGEREEAKVIRVINRGKKRYVGEVKKAKRDYYIDVDDIKMNQPIYVDHAHMHGAMIGHKVVVEIKVYKPKLKGDIVKIIGHVNDPDIDILSVVHSYDVDIEFPKDVYEEVSKIGDTIDESDIENRVDLRNEVIVTIDGDDAKDLDDAISLKKLSNGNYQLGVHIADVSYYVKEGSPLDKEAINRGTSIYLVDRVIPMLPHKLSNGICSLNPNVDRYTISCIMEINDKGKVIDHKIIPSVIHSSYRMTYNNVNKILDGDFNLQEKYKPVVQLFFLMEELAMILRKNRDERGSIDFDVNEGKILVDKNGKPTDVVLRQRGTSDKIIEEFMLKANETVAEHFKWLDVPFIYRIHEYPKEKKLTQFQSIIKPLGYTIKGSLDHIYPKELSKIVDMSKGTEEHTIISTLLLRCMQKARYDEQCLGHYGLAFDYYTHFTSPIRRYPDLLVHRLIRKYLFEEKFDMTSHYASIIPALAEQSSNRERQAIDIEREVEDMKMAEYMSDHIGEVYEGMISSITSFGFFVELPNTIEGLVHISDLTDDYYIYDEKTLMLIGERTKKQYKISDKVKVKVVRCNKEEKTIDFELIGQKRNFRRKEKVVSVKKVKTKRFKNSKINRTNRKSKRRR
ncbi:MAG: ribonuclease R [Bacilli bacterium]|nr:ribonuclease R [Bacilli bacterium]